MKTWAYNRKFLIFCIYINGAHTSPVVAFFANIIECEHDGTIANSHNCASNYFQVPFALLSPSSLLELPIKIMQFSE